MLWLLPCQKYIIMYVPHHNSDMTSIYTVCMNNNISLKKKIGLDVMESHPLHVSAWIMGGLHTHLHMHVVCVCLVGER